MAIFSTSQTKTLSPSKQTFVELIMWAGPPSRHKFIMISVGIAAPDMGEVFDWRSFFPEVCASSAQPTLSLCLSPTYYASIDAVSAKDVPFKGLINTSHPMRELSPNPIIVDVNGDFQL
jgi:hypothetical protein